jgi:choline dehydrogenase-like flavoprotein
LLIDARALSENEIIETDICIIGAGPAGITLAHEFLGQPFRVCLLESGGLEPDEQTESLSEGENIGLPYLALKTTRFRYFGGTLGMGAWCGPLDEIDFEKRDWVPYSGWPFDKSTSIHSTNVPGASCGLDLLTMTSRSKRANTAFASHSQQNV